MPISRARRPISLRRSSVASLPAPVPTITIRPFIASAREVGLEVRAADELEHDVRAALGLRARDELPRIDHRRPERGDLLAQPGGADGREHPGAGDGADLHRGRADAAVGAVDDEQLAGPQARPGS